VILLCFNLDSGCFFMRIFLEVGVFSLLVRLSSVDLLELLGFIIVMSLLGCMVRLILRSACIVVFFVLCMWDMLCSSSMVALIVFVFWLMFWVVVIVVFLFCWL